MSDSDGQEGWVIALIILGLWIGTMFYAGSRTNIIDTQCASHIEKIAELKTEAKTASDKENKMELILLQVFMDSCIGRGTPAAECAQTLNQLRN